MSYLHLTRTRTRERSPSPSFRPLTRRYTKRSRLITLSDDEDGADDYPYSSTHRPVRALALRNQPSQLERYNIWSDSHKSPAKEDDEWERERDLERTREWKYTSSRGAHHHHHHRHHSDSECDPEERAFRLKVQATFSRPSTSHAHHHHHSSFFPSVTDSFRRKEKYVDENWETRERSRSRSGSRERVSRRDSFWGDDGFWGSSGRLEREKESEDEKDVWRRYRKVKRTKTEEWRPLTGWRRV